MKGEKFIFFNTESRSVVSWTSTGSDTITFQAHDGGIEADIVSIQVRHDDAAGTVTVSNGAIIIGIGGGGDKGGDDIEGYFNGSAAATALGSISVSGTAHLGATYDSLQKYCSGGGSYQGFPLSHFMGMGPSSDSALTLYFKSMKNHCGSTLGDTEVVNSDTIVLNLATNNTHRELMNELCKLFDSASGGYGDIFIGDDRAGGGGYVSTLISGVGAITLAAANS